MNVSKNDCGHLACVDGVDGTTRVPCGRGLAPYVAPSDNRTDVGHAIPPRERPVLISIDTRTDAERAVLASQAALQATPTHLESTYSAAVLDGADARTDAWSWAGLTAAEYSLLGILAARRIHGNAGTSVGTDRSAAKFVRAGVKAQGAATPQDSAVEDAVSEGVLIFAGWHAESWEALAFAATDEGHEDHARNVRKLARYMARQETCARIEFASGPEAVTRYLVACAARDGVRRGTHGHTPMKAARDAASHRDRASSYAPVIGDDGYAEGYKAQDTRRVVGRGADDKGYEGSAPQYVGVGGTSGIVGEALRRDAEGFLVNPVLAAITLCDGVNGAAIHLYGSDGTAARARVVRLAQLEYASTYAATVNRAERVLESVA